MVSRKNSWSDVRFSSTRGSVSVSLGRRPGDGSVLLSIVRSLGAGHGRYLILTSQSKNRYGRLGPPFPGSARPRLDCDAPARSTARHRDDREARRDENRRTLGDCHRRGRGARFSCCSPASRAGMRVVVFDRDSDRVKRAGQGARGRGPGGQRRCERRRGCRRISRNGFLDGTTVASHQRGGGRGRRRRTVGRDGAPDDKVVCAHSQRRWR